MVGLGLRLPRRLLHFKCALRRLLGSSARCGCVESGCSWSTLKLSSLLLSRV